ncbi:formyltransferase family protein [uncultured Thiohalocapsa sp.]|uniref:methionyl-tRNA formyltransferase n=1 Tax=uncultured Thiohalocapsa sp. TaxID=768990 RepID=UPI0025CE938C|nr:formyltransferase family protein [uncultured Thiohalocapsa sp.]
MPQTVLYLLGQKGYQVLNAAIIGGYKDLVTLVVVGRDKNVQKDFADEIVELCARYSLKHCERNDSLAVPGEPGNYIAIAAGWRWLIKEAFHQVIVFHDSLLPKYRGFNPLVTALLNRDTETGVTAIIANKDFDCGDIVDSKSITLKYPVKIGEAIDAISKSYFDLAQSLLSRLRQIGVLEGKTQDESRASYSVWRDEEDYRIDWTRSAESIVHFVNCLSFPYKGASTLYDGRPIRILEARTEPDVEIANRDAGKVLFTVDEKPVVICGVGLLRIDIAADESGQSILPFKNFRTRLK